LHETLVIVRLAGYKLEIGAALWRLEDARNRTLRLLNNLPAEYTDLETTGNTIGTILYHMALIEADWLFAEILQAPVPGEIMSLLPVDDRDQAGILTLVRGQSLEGHLTRLSLVRKTLLEKLRGMTSDDFHRPRNLPNYDVSPAWVLHHLSQHEAEHRGEIGSIIALLKSSQ